MSEPLVSIVLAPHNGMEYLPACLDSIFAQEYQNFEVILVDNASTDGSPAYIESRFPQIHLIKSEENLAYGKGNNLGASTAKGEFLLFLNHDTTVTDGFLVELLRAMEDSPEAGVVQSKILMAAQRHLVDSAGAYLTRSGMWYHPGRGDPDSTANGEPVEILGAAGACLLTRREVFQALGGFDPDFVIYFDDADFSWRARLLGHRVLMAPRSVIYHWGGVTTKRLPSSFTVYHSFKNRICSLVKLMSVRDQALTLPVHLALCIAAALVYLIKRKPANSVAILRALRWNFVHLPQTLAKRRSLAELRHGRPYDIHQLLKPLPIGWFLRTAGGYLAQW